MTLPDIDIEIRPDSTFIVSGTAILGSTTYTLGSMLLGPAAAGFVNLTGQVIQVSIHRGRTRATDSFDSGTASVTFVDTQGTFNPDNTSSSLYQSGQSWVLPLRQFRISATVNGTVYQLFNGYTTRYTYQFQQGFDATWVTIEAEDAFRTLNMATVTTVTGATFGEDSGTRIGRILTALAVPTSIRDISTGVTVVADDPDTTRGGLEAIQQIEDAELGAYFMDKRGFHTFRNRHELQQLAGGYLATPLVFNETTGIPFTSMQIGYDDQQIVNHVTIDGDLLVGSEATDATSIADYFDRSFNKSGSFLTTDTDADQQAQYLVAARKDPRVTIDSIDFDVRHLMVQDIADAQAVVDAELLEPVTITKDYASGTIQRTLTIQGINHEITPSSWQMTFELAEPVGGDAMILDYGLLDTNLLGY